VSAIYVDQLKPWEETTDDRKRLVANIVALGASNEERSLAERRLVRVGEGEVCHIVERLGENAHRYAKLEGCARFASHEVSQEELANWKVLCVRLHKLIGLSLTLRLRPLDMLHAFCVLWEVARQGRIDWCIVHGYDVGAAVWVPESHGHDCLCSHRVSYERRILQLVLLEEGFYVFGECGVVVDLIVRGFAVVSCIDGIYGPLEDARKCTGSVVLVTIQKKGLRGESYFPTPWLFLLLPNNPCTITIGSPSALPESS
jgi:hypothetical protein